MLLTKLREIRKRLKINSQFIASYPPGHFYSPLPAWPGDLNYGTDRALADSVKAIDLRVAYQLELLKRFAGFYQDIPGQWITEILQDNVAQISLRYRLENDFFSYGDGVVYYSILRDAPPKRVIEIGSGWSSALLLDLDEIFFNSKIKKIFIDPDTTRLNSLISDHKDINTQIISKRVQEVSTDIFTSLESGDILFVDSSHVGKLGSDLLFILFEILPVLVPGVRVHFHDIPWPFEYPNKWFEAGRAWNEAYFVRTLLQDSCSWQILFFNSFIEQQFAAEYSAALPLAMQAPKNYMTIGNSSLWLEKIM